MSILTESERNAIEDECEMMIGKPAFDAIEAAVIRKLATVSVEPCAWWCCVPGQDVSLLIDEPPDSRYPKGYKDPLYFEEAIAAARVQALEEAAKVAEGYPKYGDATAAEIRALIT